MRVLYLAAAEAPLLLTSAVASRLVCSSCQLLLCDTKTKARLITDEPVIPETIAHQERERRPGRVRGA